MSMYVDVENEGFPWLKVEIITGLGFFHKTGVTLVGRRIRMDMRILCALVWLSMRNMHSKNK